MDPKPDAPLPDECKLSEPSKKMITKTAEDLVDYLALVLASAISARFPKLAPVAIYMAKRMMQHFTAETMEDLISDAERLCGRVVDSPPPKDSTSSSNSNDEKDDSKNKLDVLLKRPSSSNSKPLRAPQGSKEDTTKAGRRLTAAGISVQTTGAQRPKYSVFS